MAYCVERELAVVSLKHLDSELIVGRGRAEGGRVPWVVDDDYCW
ncbi:MAG: hypothetical protein NTU41_04460 [Chloroflexi bacterium]|nr:hypothetical protein [Chloroflexota bacterium]